MARSFDNLFQKLAHFDNLYLAYRKAAKGKRGQPEVAAFEFDVIANLCRLQEELVTQTYQPGGYFSFFIRDPKHRLISAAPFRDRVVHHCLCNIIEPLFERTFIGDSYANRVGKGAHAALDLAQSFARRYRHVLQCDVRQFFPSVDLQILYEILQRKLADRQVLWLCENILNSGAGVLKDEYDLVYFPGDDGDEDRRTFSALRPRGLPIGNLTSQFWANVYLNELDQFVKRHLHVRAYLRYVDDFLLFADDKRTLWDWKDAIREKLASLRLTLHEASSTVYPVSNGIPFLGFRLYPGYRRLKRRNALAFQRRFKRLRKLYARGEIDLAEVNLSVQGWAAHAAHGDTWGLRKALLNPAIPRKRKHAR
jgi:RNA-directed DNA polymerase